MTDPIIRQCYPEHLLSIDISTPQRIEFVNVVLTGGRIAEHGIAQSVWFDNRCIWAGGVVEKWDSVGFGWALFGKGSYQHIGVITDCARGMITAAPYKRVEVIVEADYDAGHRWAKALGLTLEAPQLRCYGPGGRDVALYSYVRG